MTMSERTSRRPGITTHCPAGDWTQVQAARHFDLAASDAAFESHRAQSHPSEQISAVRTRRYRFTTTLTVINVTALVISAFAALVTFQTQTSDFGTLLFAFPTVAILFGLPGLWFVVFLVAVLISVSYASGTDVRTPWWPRFYQALAWCGVATLVLGWATTAFFITLANVTHVS